MKVVVEKSEINPNLSVKGYLIGVILTLLLTVGMVCATIWQIFDTKDYVKVPATVTYVSSKRVAGNERNRVNYYQFKYNYNYLDYTSELDYTLFTTKGVGDKINVYINPDNPKEVRNTRIIIICSIISVLLIPTNIIVIHAYKQRKQLEKNLNAKN